MNLGGEPEHDDYSLPRVDIEIPDDARELDREVQAYHRELRALRRDQRSRRWRTPMRQRGAGLPLIAGSIVLAMISVLVLTVFSANPYFSGNNTLAPISPAPSSQRQASTAPSARPAGARLPGESISVAGKPVALRSIVSAALAIVPANCRCAMAVRQLVGQAKTAGVAFYLVGSPGSGAALGKLATSEPGARAAFVAVDTANVLASAYRPVGLTLLLVDAHGTVTVASQLRSGLRFENRLRSLRARS
ncbi:MAG TPA: hypothetical protein VNF47_22430 [Streptosporangiaceae bacterium]|nr:hypothetical protein [Streptosporangiaceae bacterium]